MGFAVPAALGVHVARPDRRAIVIVGDGAFQMTGTEISTACACMDEDDGSEDQKIRCKFALIGSFGVSRHYGLLLKSAASKEYAWEYWCLYSSLT
jgi:hypothetical protein